MDAYDNALRLVKARNISGRERYEIESKVNEDTADYAASIRTYKAWAAHFPKDYLPHFYLAGVLREMGDSENGLGEMEAARNLSPRNFVVYPHLAGHYMAAGRWNDVDSCIAKLHELNEPNWAVAVSARLAFAQGDYKHALAFVEQLTAIEDGFWPVVAPFYKARVLAESGDIQAARDALEIATSLDRQRGLRAEEAERRVAIAYLAWQQHDVGAAREEIEKAMESLEHPDSIALAGAVLARLGELRGASRVSARLDRWPDVPRVIRARRRVQAEIAIFRGDPLGARFRSEALGIDRAPVSLDFALQTAQRLRVDVEVRKAASAILADPDLQMNSISASWWITPGLLRLASMAKTPALNRNASLRLQ
jgi:tetratricopeptide (TPR) repeat protein